MNRKLTPGQVAPFGPISSERPADTIVEKIRERLVSSELKVGDKLPSERELEQQFQVSRNSIRQALKALTNMGLLEIRKGAKGGAFVTSGGGETLGNTFSDLFHLGAIDARHLTEVRVIIGTEIARLASERATSEEIEQIEANIVAAEAAVRAGNTALRTTLNLDFHRLLATMSHNPLLDKLSAAVLTVTGQLATEMPPMPDRSVMALRRRLLAHLKSRDADAAAAEMRKHLLRVAPHYLKYIKKTDQPSKRKR